MKLEIYPDRAGSRARQIEHGWGNATVWTYPFATEQAALDAALEVIDTVGIEAFIRPAADPLRSLVVPSGEL